MIPLSPLGYIRLGVAVVLLGAVVWLGFIVNGWRQDAERLALVEAERDQALADLSQERINVAEAQEASRGYQSELQTLRIAATNSRRVRPVRLCQSTPQTNVRKIPADGAGSSGAAAGAGELPQEADGNLRAGPDISADLYAEADRADEMTALARAAVIYGRSCSGVQ